MFFRSCNGPDGHGFMPAFFLTPFGGLATAFSLWHAIQQIRKKDPWSWFFWPFAIIFAIVLIAVITFVAIGIVAVSFRSRQFPGR